MNWSGGTVVPVGGNIVIAGGTGLTVDGGVRKIGELKLSAPGAFTIGASGGGDLAQTVTKTGAGRVVFSGANKTYLNAECPRSVGRSQAQR